MQSPRSDQPMRETSAAEEQQNRAESILEHQTEVEVEFHVEGGDGVAEMQQEWRDSVTVQHAEGTRADETTAVKTESKTHGTDMRK